MSRPFPRKSAYAPLSMDSFRPTTTPVALQLNLPGPRYQPFRPLQIVQYNPLAVPKHDVEPSDSTSESEVPEDRDMEMQEDRDVEMQQDQDSRTLRSGFSSDASEQVSQRIVNLTDIMLQPSEDRTWQQCHILAVASHVHLFAAGILCRQWAYEDEATKSDEEREQRLEYWLEKRVVEALNAVDFANPLFALPRSFVERQWAISRGYEPARPSTTSASALENSRIRHNATNSNHDHVEAETVPARPLSCTCLSKYHTRPRALYAGLDECRYVPLQPWACMVGTRCPVGFDRLTEAQAFEAWRIAGSSSLPYNNEDSVEIYVWEENLRYAQYLVQNGGPVRT